MKRISSFILILFGCSLFLFSNSCIAEAETLAKGAPICTTKEYFKEYIQNRNNKAVLFQMLIDGKCKCNVTGSMNAEVLVWDGWSFTKIKVLWGDEYFSGWTETQFVK